MENYVEEEEFGEALVETETKVTKGVSGSSFPPRDEHFCGRGSW